MGRNPRPGKGHQVSGRRFPRAAQQPLLSVSSDVGEQLKLTSAEVERALTAVGSGAADSLHNEAIAIGTGGRGTLFLKRNFYDIHLNEPAAHSSS